MLGFLTRVLTPEASVSAGLDPMDDRYYRPSSYGARTASGRSASPDSAMTVSGVYAGISLLSKVPASLPVGIQKQNSDGDWVDADFHPLQDVLEFAPNSWQSSFDWFALMFHHLVLRGNCYSKIVPGPRGAVQELIPVHPDRVRLVKLDDGSIAYDCTDYQAGVVGRLLQPEMFHVRSHIAPNSYVGIGVVTFMAQTVGIALAAEEHGARIFGNGARPSGIITIPGTLSDDAFDKFKERIKTQNSGLKNSGRTMVLEAGATFESITMTADEIQFLQTRGFTIEEICRFLDVPPVLLHHTTNATSFGTGIEATMLAFVRNNLMPWLVNFEQAIRRQLITAPGVYRAVFDVDSLIRGDSTALSNFIQKLTFAGVINRNEGRAILGYNPAEGLDEFLIPVTQAAPMDEPVPGESNPTPPGAPPADPAPAPPPAPPPKPPAKRAPPPKKGS